MDGKSFTTTTSFTICNFYLSTIFIFPTLDLFAMTIHFASSSLKGSSYCNHSHPCHQVKTTYPTWSLP
jgi:hypothetical protein